MAGRFFWREMRLYLVWEHTWRTPDDLLELVGIRRKEMYKASPIGKIFNFFNENESYDMYHNAILQQNLFVTAYD